MPTVHIEWTRVDLPPDARARLVAAIAPLWCTLGERARPSYFLSWGWIETWLRAIPVGRTTHLGVVLADDVPIGALFVGRARATPWAARSLPLPETGDASLDDVCVEFNGVLCPPELRLPLGLLLDELPAPWDVLQLSALDAERLPARALPEAPTPYQVEVTKRAPSYHVDLDAVRAADDYPAVVSAKTRAQLRRTYRSYQADGDIVCQAAGSLPECRAIFDELVALHQTHWQTRGHAGAFATDYFRHFHQQLIERRQPTGEIQLLRVRAGGRTVGCIYAFVYDGTVYQYQTGLAYDDGNDRDRRPGFLCNAEAIRHNARDPRLTRYDFLGGTQEYKRQLSTGQRELVWARVRQPRWRFFVERGARILRDEWRAWKKARSAGTA